MPEDLEMKDINHDPENDDNRGKEEDKAADSHGKLAKKDNANANTSQVGKGSVVPARTACVSSPVQSLSVGKIQCGFFSTPCIRPNKEKGVIISAPILRVRTEAPSSNHDIAHSENRVMQPKRLWSERSESEEESLPSPLAPLSPSVFATQDRFDAGLHGSSVATDGHSASLKSSSSSPATGGGVDSFHEHHLVADSQVSANSHTAAVITSASMISPVVDGMQQAKVSIPSSARCSSVTLGSGREHEARSSSPGRHMGSSYVQEANGTTPVQQFSAPSSPTTPAGSARLQSAISPMSVTRMAGGPVVDVGTGVFLGGRYSQADIVAFGGIPAVSAEVRSSNRVRAQPNADATQMERAQQLARARDVGSCSGYNIGYPLDPYVVLSTVGGAPTGHGFWVQPIGNGCTGFVQPVRLTA